MFVSSDKGTSKKIFQKPNILRRKVKVSAPQLVTEANKSSVRLVSSTFVEELESPSLDLEASSNPDITSDRTLQTESNIVKALRPQAHIHISWIGNNIQINNNENKFVLNKTFEDAQICVESAESEQPTTTDTKSEHWFSQDIEDEQVTTYDSSVSTEQDKILNPMQPTPVSQAAEQVNVPELPVSIAADCQELVLPPRTANGKLKCDWPNCKKEFKSEHRYRRHKDLHLSQEIQPILTTVCIERLVGTDNSSNGCGRVFLIGDKVLKHTASQKDDQCSEYKCEVCGGSLYWARDVLADNAVPVLMNGKRVFLCRWAGCGRVFRQPCRLREHARAHTGDRPYKCHYPNCKWSFRSASKLQRHRRRHTDDRRHACPTCGRAFLRREHLRDHLARHYAPRHRNSHACTHNGCKQTFTNMSTLYMHMKKVHRSEEKNTTTPAVSDKLPKDEHSDRNIDEFMATTREESSDITYLDVASLEANCVAAAVSATNILPEAEGMREDAGEGTGWQAARTHCTWPLRRQLIDDNIHVEQSECSESNNYTVKSDLFLHGNVLANEDSDSMCGVRAASADAGLDAGLGLLDAHPASDLLPEELLLTNTLDESSFRVFLYSGEDTS